jgi:predicted small secreted protein
LCGKSGICNECGDFSEAKGQSGSPDDNLRHSECTAVDKALPKGPAQSSPFALMKSKSVIRAILFLVASAFTASVLPACHTARGFGEDVKGAGRGIERAADRAAH